MKKTFVDIEFEPLEPGRRDERRTHLRYATEQLSAMSFGERSTFVEVINLSGGGAKCKISSGFSPVVGDRVNLKMVDGTMRTGIVRRTEAQAFGLEFDQELPNPEDRLFHEHRGYGAYGDIVRLQKLIHDPD